MMLRLGMVTTLGVVVLAGLPAAVQAQSSSLFGNRGPTSQSGSISGSRSVGNSGFGNSGLGNALGGSGTGRGGTGGFGQTGQGGFGQQGGATSNSGIAPLSFGQQPGFVGRAATGAFVGNAQANGAGQQGLQGLQGLQGGARGQGRNQQGRGQQGLRGLSDDMNGGGLSGGNGRTRTSTIQPRQKIAFEYTPKPATVVSQNLQRRLDLTIARRPALKGIGLAWDGEVAVLTGSVATEEQAKLAEQMIRLEPGVRAVRSELTVATP